MVLYIFNGFVFLFVCLFVCLFFHVPLENVLFIWKRHHYRWSFKLWPVLGTHGNEQIGFLSVSQCICLLWSSPRISDTHTCCWAFSSETVTTCFYDLGLPRLRFEHTGQLSACETKALAHCATAPPPYNAFVFSIICNSLFKQFTTLIVYFKFMCSRPVNFLILNSTNKEGISIMWNDINIVDISLNK